MLQFFFILWGHDNHIGNKAEKREVKYAMVRRTVIPDNSRPVNGQGDRQVGNADVVDYLIQGTLEK